MTENRTIILEIAGLALFVAAVISFDPTMSSNDAMLASAVLGAAMFVVAGYSGSSPRGSLASVVPITAGALALFCAVAAVVGAATGLSADWSPAFALLALAAAGACAGFYALRRGDL